MQRSPLFVIALLTLLIVGMLIVGVGVYPWLPPLTAGILCIAGSLLFLFRTKESRVAESSITVPAFTVVALITMALLLASALPLPGRLDFFSGFNRYEQNNAVREIVEKLPDEPGVSFSVSRNRAGTLRILTLAIIMFSAALLTSSLKNRYAKLYISILIAMGTVVAIAGFLHQWVIPAHKTIWWYRSVAHGRPVGAFVNRTHHAGFLAMLCPLPFALMLSSFSSRKLLSASLYGACSLIMLFCVTASLSRGAFAACVVGLLTVLLLALRRRRMSSRGLAIILSLLCGVAIVVGLLALPVSGLRTDVSNRLRTILSPTQMESAQSRVSVWKDAARIWTHYPILGVGANGFRAIYPQYRERADRRPFFLTENEYVELLVDGGIIGSGLVFLLFVLIMKRCRNRPPDAEGSSGMTHALAGASMAVAIHAGVDFPLHAPLYSLVFSSLIGLAIATEPSAREAIRGRLLSFAISTRHVAISLGSAGVLIVVLLIAMGSRPYNRDLPYLVQSATVKELVVSLEGSPTVPHIWHYLGLRMSQRGTPAHTLFAEHCIKQATIYDPNNYLLWEALGGIRREIGDVAGSDEAYAKMTSLRAWKRAPDTRKDQY